MTETLKIRRVAGALGAEISGLDLSQDLSDATIAAIRRALVEHQVIFFRDQELTPARQVAFGRRFGPLNIHPYVTGMTGQPEVMEIIKEPSDRLNFGGGWHSDMSFLEAPSIGSILYAVQTPDYGGDTLFASQVAAWEALSPGLQATLETLNAVHSAGKEYSSTGASAATSSVAGASTASSSATAAETGSTTTTSSTAASAAVATSSLRGSAMARSFITIASIAVWLPESSGRWKATIGSSRPPTCFQFVILRL